MSEIVTPPAEEKTLALPKITEPIIQFDKENKTFWLGIPADKVRPFEATLLMDMIKMEYYKFFTAIAVEVSSKIQKADPSVLNRLRDNFLKKTHKA